MESGYKFVVYGYDVDYFQAMFQESIDSGIVEYIDSPIRHYSGSRLKERIHHYCEHERLRKIHHLNGLRYWDRYLVGDYADSPRLCFVIMMRWLRPDNERIFREIKRRYPSAKIVIYFEDLYDTGIGKLDYTMLDRYADLVVTYDRDDARKHGFLYYPTFLSKLDCGVETCESDVTFCGAAKARYGKIIDVMRLLESKGLKCDFMVSRLLPGQQKVEGIGYIKRIISYRHYLEHVLRSRCILEIMQENATGYTLRTWEALLYDKILLTDNKAILSASFYNPEQFIYFDRPEDIPVEKLKAEIEHNPFAGNITSLKFFEFIAENLDKKEKGEKK